MIARFSEETPAGADYLDDCHRCGREYPRGDLFWSDHTADVLTCDRCEDLVGRVSFGPGPHPFYPLSLKVADTPGGFTDEFFPVAREIATEHLNRPTTLLGSLS